MRKESLEKLELTEHVEGKRDRGNLCTTYLTSRIVGRMGTRRDKMF